MDLWKAIVGGGDNSSTNNSTGSNFGQTQNYSNGINLNYGLNESGSQNTSNSVNGSQNTSQSTQDVWGNQTGYLDDVYGQAQGAFSQGMNQVDQLTPQVNGQIQDAYGQAQGGFGNQMDGGFSSALQGQIGPNSYVDAMKGQVANDAQLLKQQNLGGLDARAAAAGMSGSSGYRDQVNDMSNQIDESALNQMSQIGYNAHNQGIQNQMNLAGMMDQNQQFGTSSLQNMQQGAMNQFNPAMMGQQMASQYAQTIGGPTVLGDSSSGGSSFGSASSEDNSFSNGMNMGLGMNQSFGFGNNYGSNVSNGVSNGSTQGGLGQFFG